MEQSEVENGGQMGQSNVQNAGKIELSRGKGVDNTVIRIRPPVQCKRGKGIDQQSYSEQQAVTQLPPYPLTASRLPCICGSCHKPRCHPSHQQWPPSSDNMCPICSHFSLELYTMHMDTLYKLQRKECVLNEYKMPTTTSPILPQTIRRIFIDFFIPLSPPMHSSLWIEEIEDRQAY